MGTRRQDYAVAAAANRARCPQRRIAILQTTSPPNAIMTDARNHRYALKLDGFPTYFLAVLIEGRALTRLASGRTKAAEPRPLVEPCRTEIPGFRRRQFGVEIGEEANSSRACSMGHPNNGSWQRGLKRPASLDEMNSLFRLRLRAVCDHPFLERCAGGPTAGAGECI
jgi:hypothetical protein